MSTNKLSDDAIWEAYRKIISGQSLTRVSKELATDRGTLRKYIERVVIGNLPEGEKQNFYKKISRNFRGNSTGEGRIGRNKKAKNLTSETYLMAKQQIQSYGISEETVNQLYDVLRNRKNTSYAQGTYIIKLAEFLDYFVGKGLTSMQVIDMLNRRPQIFSADIENTINPIIEILEKNNRDGVRKIYETPSEITKGKNKVKQENMNIGIGNKDTEDQNIEKQDIKNKNIENGSDKNGRIFTNDAEVSGNEK